MLFRYYDLRRAHCRPDRYIVEGASNLAHCTSGQGGYGPVYWLTLLFQGSFVEPMPASWGTTRWLASLEV
jgi:hypothetical protein